ncbi:YfhO family protein [Candidatus Gottesmanbacteria bacterium]|nr:YfhO family protein [Candidatus Gottesmanbacteria bacterium]
MKKYLPFLAYAILIFVIFRGVLVPPEGKILFGPDITRYHYWQRQFLGTALREGSVPWWNPYTMMGVPYIEHPQIPVWSPPNLLFVVLPTNVAVSWYIALHIFLAMSGMYILLRSIGRIGPDWFVLPSWAAGVAFGLSAYFVARIPAGHIDIIAASAWTPLVIGAFWHLIQSNPTNLRHGVILSAVVLAMQLLAGHPMVAVFTMEAVLIITLFYQCFMFWVSSQRTLASLSRSGLASLSRSGLASLSRSGLGSSFSLKMDSGFPWKESGQARAGMTFEHGQSMMRVIVAIITGLALSAIQLFPNAQFIAHSIRTFPFPDSWAQLGTPTVGHLLEFLDPFYFYSRLPDSGFGFEHVGYIGKVSLLFAVLVVGHWFIAKKKRWEIPAFVLVGLFGLWMWLGANAPLDLFSWVRSWMPLYSQIRIPARHIVLVVLSASVLFGIGLSLVKSKVLQLLVVGLLLLDLVPFARRHLLLVPVPQQAEDAELVSLLTNDKSLYRFLPNFYHGDPLRDVLEFNAPIAHKIQSISGYDTPPLRNMYEFFLAVNGYKFSDILSYSESIPPFRALSSPYLNFLNVKYILVPVADDAVKNSSASQFTLVKENARRGWRLYENKNVIPRFFIATTLQKEPNRDAVLGAIGKASTEPGKGSMGPKTTIIVDGSTIDTSGFTPDCPAGYEGRVGVTSYSYGRIVLTSNNACNAFLGTSEVMYPGWTATIDGKQTPVFEGNAAFRTLYLPKGTHTITFSYRPMIVLWGALISLVAICVVFLLII